MPQYFIGGIIKEYREKNDISQKQLCRGLCSISTLCKIEKGDQNPSSFKLLEALAQRAGVSLFMIDIPLTPTEFERTQIMREIASCIASTNFEFKNLLERYESLTPSMNILEKQECLELFTIYNVMHDHDYEKEFEQYLKILQLTFPKYELSTDLSSELLTMEELSLISNIAINFNKRGMLAESINLLSKIKIYLETHVISKEDFGIKYPSITNFLANWYGISGNYEQALKIANDGIKACQENNRLSSLSDLLYSKGFTLILLKRKTQGFRVIRQALCLTKIIKSSERFLFYQQDIISSFGQTVWNEIAIN